VQGLPTSITLEILETWLSLFGHILSSKIPPPKQGRDFGVAYVQFAMKEAADAVIAQAQHGLHIGGCRVSATNYMPYEQRMKQKSENFTNLYVKNLPDSIQHDEDLRSLFASYGKVTSVRLEKVRFI
jgi:polyadenylate-binding protein